MCVCMCLVGFEIEMHFLRRWTYVMGTKDKETKSYCIVDDHEGHQVSTIGHYPFNCRFKDLALKVHHDESGKAMRVIITVGQFPHCGLVLMIQYNDILINYKETSTTHIIWD